MRDHRPGPGSWPPNWGTQGDRVRVTFSWDSIPSVTRRHTPDPASQGLAPGPVTGRSWRDHPPTRTRAARVRRGRPMRPDDRVNDSLSRCGVGLEPPTAGGL